MARNQEGRLVLKKGLKQGGEARMSEGICGERVYVTFAVNGGKTVVQRGFQGTMSGRAEARGFYDSMDSAAQVMAKLGIGRGRRA